MKKNPFLKGKLTKISAALLVLVQSPNLFSDISSTAQVFAENADKPVAYISIVAAAGILWGGIRRALNYATPKLVIAQPDEK